MSQRSVAERGDGRPERRRGRRARPHRHRDQGQPRGRQRDPALEIDAGGGRDDRARERVDLSAERRADRRWSGARLRAAEPALAALRAEQRQPRGLHRGDRELHVSRSHAPSFPDAGPQPVHDHGALGDVRKCVEMT